MVIGNGLSRIGLDLEAFRYRGVTAGCNNLYLDYDPDYLISLDHLMNRRIKWMIDRNVERNFKWVTRHTTSEGVRLVTVDGVPVGLLDKLNDGFNNQSGIFAAAFLVEILKVKKLIMLGIDFFLPVPQGSNDIYEKGGPYSDGIPYCWNLLAERNPGCEFYRCGEIADQDRDFYRYKLRGFTYVENFKDMPL